MRRRRKQARLCVGVGSGNGWRPSAASTQHSHGVLRRRVSGGVHGAEHAAGCGGRAVRRGLRRRCRRSVGTCGRSDVVPASTPIGERIPFTQTNGDILAITKVAGATRDLIAFGGNFSAVITPDGVSRPASHFAVVDEDTGALVYAGNANSYVRTITSRDGVIYVGGDFTSFGGVARSRLASLSPTFAVTSWNPAPTFRIRAGAGRTARRVLRRRRGKRTDGQLDDGRDDLVAGGVGRVGAGIRAVAGRRLALGRRSVRGLWRTHPARAGQGRPGHGRAGRHLQREPTARFQHGRGRRLRRRSGGRHPGLCEWPAPVSRHRRAGRRRVQGPESRHWRARMGEGLAGRLPSDGCCRYHLRGRLPPQQRATTPSPTRTSPRSWKRRTRSSPTGTRN